MKIKDLLRGKSKEEITSAFINKYGIQKRELDAFLDSRRGICYKFWNLDWNGDLLLIWVIPLLLLGLALFVTLTYCLCINTFPLIYDIPKKVTFYHLFIDISYGTFLYGISLFLCIFSIYKMYAEL